MPTLKPMQRPYSSSELGFCLTRAGTLLRESLLGKNCVGVLQARVFDANLLCVCLGAIRIRDFSLNAHWFPMIICHDPQTEQGCRLSVVQINLLNRSFAPKVILGQQKCLYVIHSESFLSAFPQDKGNLRRYRYPEQARLLLLRYSSPVQSAPFPEGECISTQALVFAQPC